MRAELNAENSIIGAVLIDERCIDRVVGSVRAEDFGSDTARRVFEVILALRAAGRPIDPVAVLEVLGPDYGDYLLQLMDVTPTAKNVEEYCRIVREEARRRELYGLAEDVRAGVVGRDEPSAIADMVRRRLEGISEDAGDLLDGTNEAVKWLERYGQIKRDPESAYTKTGYDSLDEVLGGGLFNADINILAGRPGMGKTTQGLAIAERVAASGRRVLFVSIEMSRQQIWAKRLANACGVSYSRIMAADLNGEEESRMASALADLAVRPFITVEDAKTVESIERYARRVPELRLLVIDYVGLIQSEREFVNRNDEVAKISQDLKALAKRLNIPILGLSQINRENTKRSDKRPTMADLRDSGAIEQDASVVMLLHREGYYKTEDRPQSEELEIIVDKNRHGRTGTVKLWWEGATGRISEDFLEMLI